ncbi:hypothetical protein AAEX28_00530 [Lentisphaerota bacterium WC36G]|nr:hypothetical protein LJT99_03410 [Lentisphaerae bacterium WC36]
MVNKRKLEHSVKVYEIALNKLFNVPTIFLGWIAFMLVMVNLFFMNNLIGSLCVFSLLFSFALYILSFAKMYRFTKKKSKFLSTIIKVTQFLFALFIGFIYLFLFFILIKQL